MRESCRVHTFVRQGASAVCMLRVGGIVSTSEREKRDEEEQQQGGEQVQFLEDARGGSLFMSSVAKFKVDDDGSVKSGVGGLQKPGNG